MYSPGHSTDVIVHVVTAPRQRELNWPATTESARSYDVLIYSHLSLPTRVFPTRSRYPLQMRNLPLVGAEGLMIPMTSYESHLASFVEGEKGFRTMRDRLISVMSDGLRKLLTEAPLEMRIWWSSEAAELEDFPWELTADPGRSQAPHRLVFVRGVPPVTPIPTIPIVESPKIAIVGAQYLQPAWARSMQDVLAPHVTAFDFPLREALEKAIDGGFEFVHIFSDGVVSSALEGILYDHDTRRDQSELSPGELSRVLADSRVVLLALSQTDYGNPDIHYLANRPVLSAYRAFAYLGGSSQQLPSILAPLGPIPDDDMRRFWETFYTELISTWHLTESLRRAQNSFSFPLPMALFCRHAGGKLFQRLQPEEASARRPVRLRSDILRSERLTNDLSALSEKYGELPESVQRLFNEEEERQTSLREKLDSWIKAEEEL